MAISEKYNKVQSVKNYTTLVVETIVFDTNLLILLVVRQASRGYIDKHKCLKPLPAVVTIC